MGIVSKLFTFTNGIGNKIDATQVNADFDTLYTLVNGNIDAANLAADSVGSSEIQTDAVGSAEIAAAAVGAAEVGTLPKAKAYHAIASAIPTGTQQPLVFNQERFDTDTIHDTSTNTGRLTCKTAGLYLVTASIEWANGGGNTRSVGIRKNGTTTIVLDVRGPTPGIFGTEQTITTLAQLAVNDYLEVVVFHDAAGNLNVNYSDPTSPEFGMAWLMP
jgi:hypothetical protein